MTNKEALKKIAEIQHRMWQVFHHIETIPDSLEPLLRIAKAQREIKAVEMRLKEQTPAPIPKHRLDPKKVYQVDIDKPEVKLLSPCLIPSVGFRNDLADEDLEAFFDRWAAEGWGNFFRFFIDGNWEPKLKLSKPYIRDGKYNLLKKDLNHFDRLWRRIGYAVERDIIPMITLQDGCSLHEDRPGCWNTHYMNGRNNVNGTHDRWMSITHCEEHLGPGEDPRWAKTYFYQNDRFEYALREAKRHFGRFFNVEILNEGDARTNYHRRLRKMCNETLSQGCLDRRVFTSMLNENKRFYSRPDSNVQQYCIRILHNVYNYQSYLDRKYLFGKSGIHMVSQDGQMPMVTYEETKENVIEILSSESKGFEGNLRPLLELRNGGEWVNVGYDADFTLRTLRYELFKAYADAFNEVIG